MKRHIFNMLLILSANLSSSSWFACAPAEAYSGRISIESSGLSRSAIIVEHERLKRSRRPTIIVLHRGNSNGARIRRVLGLEEIARSGPVMVYPDAFGGRWSDQAGPEAERDENFIHDLIGKLVSNGISDPHKIFIVGESLGGMMALRLVCDPDNSFAGAAILISGLPTDLEKSCKPGRPLPILLISGTSDPLVPYHGGKSNLPESKTDVLSAKATLGIFAKAADCSETFTTAAYPSKVPNEATRVFLEKLNGCKAPVELIRVEGGGHHIPGRASGAPGSKASGAHNFDIDAAKLIWAFFRRAGG